METVDLVANKVKKHKPAGKDSSPIASTFQRYFSILLADTPELRDQVYRVRYDVYCDEFGYEEKGAFCDGTEQDEYDPISRHCLIVHKPSGRAAGCVRVVPAKAQDPSFQLPFEKHCGKSLDQGLLTEMNLPRSSIGEISRLAVHKSFRRRSGEHTSRYGDTDHLRLSLEERRTLPYIAISAYLATIVMGDLDDRWNGFAMMEPFLPRLLARAGIQFTRVGENVDYHGVRAAYFITKEKALAGMHPELRELYEMIRLNFTQGRRS